MKRFLVVIIMLLTATGYSPANAANNGFDPSRVGWSEMRFEAAVLFFSVDANIVLNRWSAAEITEQLMAPGEGVAVAPDDRVQQLILTTDFFGRHTTSDILINAGTGAALQRTSHNSGKRFRHRIYRFTDIGAYQRTRWPVGKDEENLPTERWPEWSEAAEDLRAYPASAVGNVVTDPGGLLYIISAADLYEPGDKTEILTYARGHVHRAQVEVATPESIRVNYQERDGERSVKRKGKQQVMTLLIRGEGLDDGDDKDEFELLGLRGDIVMYMDPKTRAPLQLNGRVKIAGKVTLRIKGLVVREDSTGV